MKSIDVLLLGALSSAVLCGGANARGILVDAWQQVGSAGSGTSVSVNPASLPVGPPLAGITTLSFAPGTNLPGYLVATLGSLTEYAFGAKPPGADPFVDQMNEQVVVDPLSASKFSVAFNYADTFGGPAETASLTVNDTTYTAKNPGALSDTTGVLTFVNGVLQGAANYVGSWTETTSGGGGNPGGGMSAPEIDPASAISALTLLAGGLAILRGGKRRREVEQASFS
jgi:hypothetical protein